MGGLTVEGRRPSGTPSKVLRARSVQGAAGLGLLIVLAYLFVDRGFSTLANSWHHPAIAVDLTYIADAPLPASCAVLVFSMFRPLPRSVMAAAVATLAALALKDELKYLFGRPWPDTWINNNPSWIRDHVFGFFPLHGGAGYASFPSGHTTAIAAPASVLFIAWPRWRALAVVLVALVAAGLLVSDYHFVSDVLAGLGVGAGSASAVCRAIGVGRDGPGRAWLA